MSANSAPQGGWIPLMDYAMKKGVSLSTLRRYIKASKIRFKSEQGRYLIWDEDASVDSAAVISAGSQYAGLARIDTPPVSEGDLRVEDLEFKLRKAQEEICELKMLVALYEEQLFQKPAIQI